MKLIIFIIATLTSGLGIFASAALLSMPFDATNNTYLTILLSIWSVIHVVAWGCYFCMGWKWINNIAISKRLAIIGCISGCVALSPLFKAAVFVLPAIVMASYMAYTGLVNKTSNIL
jgi:hypothetical protein